MPHKSKKHSHSSIIRHRGEMWPRNSTNIELIPHTDEDGGQGIYILFDGSTPVYVGRGNIRHRIKDARASKRRGQSFLPFLKNQWFGFLIPPIAPAQGHPFHLDTL